MRSAPERLEDPCEDARLVGDVHPQPLERTGIVVRGRKHPATLAAGLADPAGDESRVAVAQRRLELLDPPPMLRERAEQRLAVVEEDVDPDARVGAGDPRHVAERATRRLQRIVTVDARLARLVQQGVRERVREVAGERDEPVVRAGIDRDRLCTEARDEGVERAEPLRRRRGDRREEPGRALEELGGRTARPPGLGAADRMTADEARIPGRCGDDRPLRRADVGDDTVLGRDGKDTGNELG